MDRPVYIYLFSGWDSFLGQEEAGVSLQELLASDQHHLLDRSFTVRFRCLLDNTSGFLVCKPIHVSYFIYLYAFYLKEYHTLLLIHSSETELHRYLSSECLIHILVLLRNFASTKYPRFLILSWEKEYLQTKRLLTDCSFIFWLDADTTWHKVQSTQKRQSELNHKS
jgi:hypothetical protein